MELITTTVLIFVSCLNFVIALVAILVVLKIGKGIHITVQVNKETSQEHTIAEGISAEDKTFLTELYKQKSKDMDKQQVSIDEVLGTLQSFMTGGDGHG